jgi:transposase
LKLCLSFLTLKNKIMKKLKQIVGIDVSKDTLAPCFGTVSEQEKTSFVKHASFKNNMKGFEELLAWTNELKSTDTPVEFVMEATGVYYESLAYFLAENSLVVHVLLPNKTKHFAKSLDIKSKTDRIDARMLAQIGMERQLQPWKPHSDIMNTLKQLSREHKDLKEKLTVLKNQIHAKEHAYQCPKQIMKRLLGQVKIIEAQTLQCEADIRALCAEDQDLTEKIAKIQTVPGLGFMTIVTIVAETNGFILFENSKQLVSYSGFDVVHNESGLFKGKSKISKKGNKFIRSALFMPSLCAIQHNPTLKQFYEDLVERKPRKSVGTTAVARKMLVLAYTLWKNNSEFDVNYKKAA